MTSNNKNSVSLEVEKSFFLSLEAVSCSFNIPSDLIIEMVEEGIISIERKQHNEWQFDNQAFERISKVLRLKEDLGINIAGAALVLELLDEIDRLRSLLPKVL